MNRGKVVVVAAETTPYRGIALVLVANGTLGALDRDYRETEGKGKRVIKRAMEL